MKTLAAVSVALVLLAACSSGGEGSEDAGSGGAGTVSVEDFAFDPETASVAAGEQVTWTVAEDSSDHTVKFDDEESETLAAGDTYTRTFDEAGEYTYVCGIHPQMTGAVTVE